MKARRRLNRAFELVRARRFVARMQVGPHKPGGWVIIPDGVCLQDVIFWTAKASQ